MEAFLPHNDYEQAAKKLKGKHPAPEHIDRLLDRNAMIIGPDGVTTAMLLCDVIPPELYKLAFSYGEQSTAI